MLGRWTGLGVVGAAVAIKNASESFLKRCRVQESGGVHFGPRQQSSENRRTPLVRCGGLGAGEGLGASDSLRVAMWTFLFLPV